MLSSGRPPASEPARAPLSPVAKGGSPARPRKRTRDSEEDQEQRSPNKATRVSPAPTLERIPAPDHARVSPLAFLEWVATLKGAQKVFAHAPSPEDLQKVAARHTVEQLDQMRRRLAQSASRHGPLGTSPFVALLIKYPAAVEAASKLVQFLVVEGKCGVKEHVISEVLRRLALSDMGPLFSDSALGTLPFDAEMLTEVRPKCACCDCDDETDHDDDEDVSNTVVNLASTVVTVLKMLPRDRMYVVVAYNKLAICRQIFTVTITGKLQILCCGECDELVAAEAARDIVLRSGSALRVKVAPDTVINPNAIIMPFHNSGLSEAALLCSGRRMVPTGEEAFLDIARPLQEGLRDGASEGLATFGVQHLIVMPLVHLGWAAAATKLKEGEEDTEGESGDAGEVGEAPSGEGELDGEDNDADGEAAVFGDVQPGPLARLMQMASRVFGRQR